MAWFMFMVHVHDITPPSSLRVVHDLYKGKVNNYCVELGRVIQNMALLKKSFKSWSLFHFFFHENSFSEYFYIGLTIEGIIQHMDLY